MYIQMYVCIHMFSSFFLYLFLAASIGFRDTLGIDEEAGSEPRLHK